MRKYISKSTLEAAQRGNSEAICLLLDEVQPSLHNYASRVCINSEDAKDAVQESLFIISHKLHGLKNLSAFVGWAFRILLRECLRLKEKARHFLSNQPVESLVTDLGGADEVSKLEMATAIESLPSNHRIIIILHYFLGYTALEISEKLDISLKAAKSRVRRAKNALYDKLI